MLTEKEKAKALKEKEKAKAVKEKEKAKTAKEKTKVKKGGIGEVPAHIKSQYNTLMTDFRRILKEYKMLRRDHARFHREIYFERVNTLTQSFINTVGTANTFRSLNILPDYMKNVFTYIIPKLSTKISTLTNISDYKLINENDDYNTDSEDEETLEQALNNNGYVSD